MDTNDQCNKSIDVMIKYYENRFENLMSLDRIEDAFAIIEEMHDGNNDYQDGLDLIITEDYMGDDELNEYR